MQVALSYYFVAADRLFFVKRKKHAISWNEYNEMIFKKLMTRYKIHPKFVDNC